MKYMKVHLPNNFFYIYTDISCTSILKKQKSEIMLYNVPAMLFLCTQRHMKNIFSGQYVEICLIPLNACRVFCCMVVSFINLISHILNI